MLLDRVTNIIEKLLTQIYCVYSVNAIRTVLKLLSGPRSSTEDGSGSSTFWREAVSFENQYNSRVDPNYPMKGKASIVKDAISIPAHSNTNLPTRLCSMVQQEISAKAVV